MTAAVVHVNGQATPIDDADRTLLVDHLRNAMRLKGTRYGCGEEQCGACVVTIDGQARVSCRTEVGQTAGKHVTTVEGLASRAAGRELLRAFEELQAGQCAFCLSGILMRALSLLEQTPAATEPDRARIAAALEPHLCRCGTHPRILAAIEAAWRRHRES